MLFERYAQHTRNAQNALSSRQVSKSSEPSSLAKMFEGFQRGWTQTFPPVPTFTEQSIKDLSGRVSTLSPPR